MSEQKAKVITAQPVEVLESKVTTIESVSIDDLVDDIINQKEGISDLINKVTETITQSSSSSLVKEDDKETEEVKSVALNEQNSKAFINKVVDFLAGREFEEQCKATGTKYNLPPKVVAKNFCLRILGTIGDVLGIAINVTRNFVKSTIQLLVSLLFGAIDVVCDVAQGLASILTLNQTAQPKAQ